jgi:UDP-glucose 6-dehydrogenase
MTNRTEIIAELKAAHPTLRTGDESAGYTELSKAEYLATIIGWADNTLAQLADEAEAEANAAAKAALLARLGITADEAKLLLG